MRRRRWSNKRAERFPDRARAHDDDEGARERAGEAEEGEEDVRDASERSSKTRTHAIAFDFLKESRREADLHLDWRGTCPTSVARN